MNIWHSISQKHRTSFIIILLAVVLLTAISIFFLFSHNYTLLFSNLSQQEQSLIVKELNRSNIDYTIDDQSNLYVDPNQLHKARLAIANSGLEQNQLPGLELFDQADYGISKFAQKINYQRALQGELVRTINTLSEVKFSRVHIVLPETSAFRVNSSKAKASVTLALYPGKKLNARQIEGLRTLVASAVPTLSTNQVMIIDQNGQQLSTDSNKYSAFSSINQKRDLEQFYQKKVERLLNRVVENNQYTVNIDIELNQVSESIHQERSIPVSENGQAIIKQAIEDKKYHFSNDKQSDMKLTERLTDEHIRKEFVFSKETRTKKQPAGTIKSITVAVLLSSNLDTTAQNKLTDLISKSVGLQTNRGDSISVSVIPAIHLSESQSNIKQDSSLLNVDEPSSETTFVQAVLNNVIEKKQSLSIIFSVIGIILFFIVLLNIRRNSPKRLSNNERQQLLLDIKDWLKVDSNEH
ncbi:flagellar basal-body MS-ring/collar protein FliF [Zooshikella harenae]|uniref:Flagellar M-ring protein n=1 Tax=Zooshikella harenae TaxID=2827238 RepID=A0ABS5ZCD3_9GAMM|nr:flagellar basal-body MS-ring/collar protein FliF [Zooshikella harenae]MBU2711659.1 flagellar M-ring protein FliF [Zooshikella harenae]